MEPASRAHRDGAARGRGALRTRQGHDDHLVVDPEPSHPADVHCRDERDGARPSPGDRARGRGRVRRQDQHLWRGVRRGRALEAPGPTGQPLREFGEGGKVNLRDGVPRLDEFRWTAAPLICRDTIIVGIFTLDKPADKEQVPGYVRGFDAVTGQLKWVFNPVPGPGEFGHETWEDGSWEYTGSSNVWTVASADEELGYAYLPTATPTHNWYGGHRPGDNLFAESLVCLECETGRRVWHYTS